MTLHAPLERAERIAMEIRRAEQIEESYRAHRRFLFRVSLGYVFWLVLGCFLMGLSFNLTNPRHAELVFQLSFLVGYGGMFFYAVFAYARGRERGEWN